MSELVIMGYTRRPLKHCDLGTKWVPMPTNYSNENDIGEICELIMLHINEYISGLR